MADRPWYQTTLRWGQTNLTEIDPSRYDDAWWRAYWRRTRIQGVIVNAGGIVAYYPSAFPLHHRAETLGDRDLYGEIVASARDEGLAVVARMDSNRVDQDFLAEHPDWVCRDRDGQPYQLADKFVTCINSPYYREYLPAVLGEIIERSQPDGFADNSWAGLPRSNICYCDHCAQGFASAAEAELPVGHDWNNASYRSWVAWSYRCRTDLWDFNNEVTRNAGGPNCRWMGMLSGDLLNNSHRFIDLRAILSRSEIVMLDHQHRNLVDGFEQNTEAGKRLHEILGWDKLIPESIPQYQLGVPAFRVAAQPPAEVRLWAVSGFAGGIQPWWHHIGASHDDRRQYRTAEPIFTWHEANSGLLLDREPLADVGIVWSQRNNDVYGRESAADKTVNPYRGMVTAVNQAGLTYLPVNADDLATANGRFQALVLPNIGALSDNQAVAIKTFAAGGGSVIATGETGWYDEDGELRPRPALADLFAIQPTGEELGSLGLSDFDLERPKRHTYLRLLPELRSSVDGPHDPSAPRVTEARHPVLTGLDETDLLAFGGWAPAVEFGSDVEVLATWVPPFPIFPPETSWMRTPQTNIGLLGVRHGSGDARLAWLAADIDRCLTRDEQPDHALLLGNLLRWAVGGRPVAETDGAGLVATSLYRQGARRIVHITNMLRTSRIPGRQRMIVPVGPVKLRVRLDEGERLDGVSLHVSGDQVPARLSNDHYVHIEVPNLDDHELVVIEIESTTGVSG